MATLKQLVMVAAGAAFLGLGVAGVEPVRAASLEPVTVTFDNLPQGPIGGFFAPNDTIQFFTRTISDGPGPDEENFNVGNTCNDATLCSGPNALAATVDPDDEFDGSIIGRFFQPDTPIEHGVGVTEFAKDVSITLIGLSPREDAIRAFARDQAITTGARIMDGDSDPVIDANTGLTTVRFGFNFENTNGISSFEIVGDDTRIDNVTYTPVPEPSTVLGTVAIGVLGGGLMLKRKLQARKVS